MATYYWVGGDGVWNTSGSHWSAATGKAITASCSGSTLTVTAGTVVVGDEIWSNNNTYLGYVLSSLGGGQWSLSSSGTFSSQTMTAATTVAAAPTSADNVIFDANSGTANFGVTVQDAVCNNFTVSISTAGRLTFAFGVIYCYGTPTVNAATTISVIIGGSSTQLYLQRLLVQ